MLKYFNKIFTSEMNDQHLVLIKISREQIASHRYDTF